MPMLEALKIVKEVSEAKGITMYARNVPGAVHSITDMLSRNRIKFATDLSNMEFKQANRVQVGKLVGNWMARMVRTALSKH